jgi:hypothetical protein
VIRTFEKLTQRAYRMKAEMTLSLLLLVAGAPRSRNIRHNRSGKVSAENVGIGLIVVGGLLAFLAAIAQIWFLSYGWTYIYTVLFAGLGLALLIVGAVIYGAE